MEQYKQSLSVERLKPYKLKEDDSREQILERYLRNIELSEALYPALALLEVTLRNKIDYSLCAHFNEDWLLDEYSVNKILHEWEYEKTYKPTYERVQSIESTVTKGKLLPELNFGFWVSLCKTEYFPKIWMRPNVFNEAFPYFDVRLKDNSPRTQIGYVSQKVRHLLRLRNRIFHHEPILFNPYLEKNYNDIEELLGYMSKDTSNLLLKVSRFRSVLNKK